MRRTLLVAALLITALPAVAEGAILIEAERQGEPFRLVVDAGRGLALVTTRTGSHLIDLDAGAIYAAGGGTPRRLPLGPDPAATDARYQVATWGQGPILAGQPTVYQVITRGQSICAEMMVTAWTAPVIQPAVRALDLLEQASGRSSGRGGCADIPFSVYAAAGWPMLAGKIDHLTFRTRSLRFDYTPEPGELTVPEFYETTDRIVIEAFAPRR